MHTFLQKLEAFRTRFSIRGIALAVVIAMLSVTTMTGITYATNVVYIYDDEDVLKFYTTDSSLTARQILTREQVEFSPQDEIIFSGFEDGEASITIYRAFTVNITADGTTTEVTMTRGTVGDALDKADVVLNDDDLINVSPYEEAVSGMEIVINRVTYQTVTEETAIPFEVETTETYALSKGKTIVTQVGQEGKQVATYEQMLVDGEVASTELLDTQVVSQPVNQRQTVGTNPKQIASDIIPPEGFVVDENGVPANYSKVLTGKATAYSSSRVNVRGASGQRLVQGSVAVDPNIIPYGTKLYITSADGSYIYGYAVAADTGTALMDGRVLVDCFFNTYGDSCRFGAKTVKVYVLS